MLAQYGATREMFIGLTPADFYKHDLETGRRVWREFFDHGQLHIKTRERRLDGNRSTSKATTSACTMRSAGSSDTSAFSATSRRRSGCRRKSPGMPPSSRPRVAERTAELARSESRIRAIVNALPDLVFVLDGDGRYLESVTGKRRALLLRRRPDLLGRRVTT